MNNGGIAHNVKIDVKIDGKIENKIFLTSIPNDGYVNLDVSPYDCIQNNKKICVNIEYKKSYGLLKNKNLLT
jgi:hypothetical protein